MKETAFFGRIKSPKLLDFFNMRKCSIEKVNQPVTITQGTPRSWALQTIGGQEECCMKSSKSKTRLSTSSLLITDDMSERGK